jgi:NADH dehydrogenase [ubiquinone] 1 alpha subcomplex assembly factor 6
VSLPGTIATRHLSLSSEEYCMSLVKKSDFDNYLCGLLMPMHVRRTFFAIRAFNCEIAQIRDQSRNNNMTGRLRFQYWKDMIGQIYDCSNSTPNQNHVGIGTQLTDQPIGRELIAAVRSHGLTQRHFEKCIEARVADFLGNQPEKLSDLEWYAESSQSSLLYLHLECLNIKEEKAMYIASHIGCAIGIATLLRGLPYHFSQVIALLAYIYLAFLN